MTRSKKILVAVLSALMVVCLTCGVFAFTACGEDANAELSSIKLDTRPTKTVYVVGESFDATGMKVVATYADKSTKDVTADVTYDTSPLAVKSDYQSTGFASSQSIKISYTEGEVTKTASLSVSVTNKITAATIAADSDYTDEYYLGARFDPTGLKINATLEDKTTQTIEVTRDNATINPSGALSKGTESVEVVIGGFTLNVPVTIRNALYVEAETGYRNGETIAQTTGDSGNLRTDATRENAETGAQDLYAAKLKADFALSQLREGEDWTDEHEAELASTPATPDDLYGAFGGNKSVYSSDVKAGGEIISKLYIETVNWISENEEAVTEYAASEEFEAALQAYIDGENEDINDYNYEADVEHYLASGDDEYYLGQNNQGDVISFLFESSNATTGTIAFRLSSAYLYADSGWRAIIMGDIQFNRFCDVYVNGTVLPIDDSKVLQGGKSPDGTTNQILWVNWDTVEFSGVAFVEGRNVIELRIKNHGIAAQEGYSFAANVDTLLVTPDKTAGGDDSAELDTYDDTATTIVAAAASVAVSGGDTATLTVSGSYTGVKGYVGDKIGVTVGGVAASVTTDATAGTFTATADVTEFAFNDFAIQIIGNDITADDGVTVDTTEVTVGRNQYRLVVDEETKVVTLNKDSAYKVSNITPNIPEDETATITLKAVDDKAIIAIDGTYTADIAGYNMTNADDKAEVKAILEKEIVALYFFDMQRNNNWDYPLSGVSPTVTVDVDANTFTLEQDVTSWPEGNPGFIHLKLNSLNTGSDGWNDYKPDIDVFSQEVTVGTSKYTLAYDKSTCFGLVFLTVVDTAAKKFDTGSTVSLEADTENAKMYLVIDGTYQNYDDMEELAADVLESVDTESADNWAKVDRTDLATVVTDETEKTFRIKVDITDVDVGQYLVHLNGGDVGNENGITAITVGDKSYSYEFRDFGGWTRYVLTIKAAA